MRGEEAKTNNLIAGTPTLTTADITASFKEIRSDETAQIIGLTCHLAHWRVFGHLNQLPLDEFHLKQLFI